MKKSKLAVLLLILIIGVLSLSYHPGIDVDKLREKYTYAESDFIDFEGMQIHYRKTGNGPVLFLMHGVSSSLHTWEKWHEILSKDFTVVSIDVPSFGLTGPNPKADYSIEMYMRTIDFITKSLNINSMFVAGNSYGGYLSWHYAIHNPVMVKKVVLLDAAGFKLGNFKDIGFKLMANKLTSGMATRFTPIQLINKSVKNCYGNPALVNDDLVERYHNLLLRKGNRKGFAKILQSQVASSDLTEKIGQVSQPTLIIWGDQDRIIDVKNAHLFNQHIKDSELKIYEGVGHVPMEEIPEETALLTKEFLLK
jgi:pimeloyl-ACP methyl ester carboxylesterase